MNRVIVHNKIPRPIEIKPGDLLNGRNGKVYMIVVRSGLTDTFCAVDLSNGQLVLEEFSNLENLMNHYGLDLLMVNPIIEVKEE